MNLKPGEVLEMESLSSEDKSSEILSPSTLRSIQISETAEDTAAVETQNSAVSDTNCSHMNAGVGNEENMNQRNTNTSDEKSSSKYKIFYAEVHNIISDNKNSHYRFIILRIVCLLLVGIEYRRNSELSRIRKECQNEAANVDSQQHTGLEHQTEKEFEDELIHILKAFVWNEKFNVQQLVLDFTRTIEERLNSQSLNHEGSKLSKDKKLEEEILESFSWHSELKIHALQMVSALCRIGEELEGE